MDKEPARQFFPKEQVNRMMAGKPPKPPSSTTQVLAGTAGSVLVVNLLHNVGAPEGILASSWNSLRSTALLFGGPVALGLIATQQMDPKASVVTLGVIGSALALAGMMATKMIPWQIDLPLFTTIATSAVGVYGGIMLADKLL